MNRFLKWMLALVAVVVILFVVAAIVLPMLIDPNNYKDEIRNAVLEETGRELTIGGEIEWTVFPSVGLDFNDLSLSNRVGFGDQAMIEVGGASVSVELIPLFSRQVKVRQISLTGVSAYLRQNSDGQNNWEDLTSARETSTDAQIPGGEVVVDSEIEISNGAVTLSNTNQSIDMQKFAGISSGIELGQPFEMNGEFSVNLVQEEVVGEVEFSGLVQPSSNAKWVGIEGIDVSFRGEQGLAEESLPLDMTATAHAEIDLASDLANLSDLVYRFFNLEVSGDIKVTSLANDPVYTGEFKLVEFSPRALMENLGVEVPQTRDAAALTKMWGDMRFAGSSGSFNMQDLSVKLDKSTFSGNFKIEGTDNQQLAYDFDIDRLNLDDYSATPGDATSGNSGAESVDPMLAFGIFFILPGGGDLRIGELVSSGLVITDISVKTSSDINALRIFPISAKLYGGQQQGDIKIDISGDRPILTSNQVLTGIEVEGLLRDLTGNANLQGTGDFYMKIRTDLTNSETSRRALSGDIGLSITDGAIVGIDVAKTVSTVASALGKQAKTEQTADKAEKTEFAEFIVTGIFENGILKSNDLVMQSPLLTATGKGSINLVNETITYVLKPELVEDMGIEGLDRFTGVPIPIRISGSYYEPDFSIDVAAALTGSQKARLDAKKDELASDLLDKVFGSKKDKKKKKDDGGGF